MPRDGFLDEIDDLNALIIRSRAKKMVGVERKNIQYTSLQCERI